MTQGFVYILTNPSMPGLVKIGKTTRDVEQRIKELSNATGVPTPFELYQYQYSPNCHDLEDVMHQIFRDARVNEGREFFRLEPHIASETLRIEHMQILNSYVEEFAPGHVVCFEPLTVSDHDVALVAQQIGADAIDVASALTYVHGNELHPALRRWDEIKKQRLYGAKLRLIE